MYIHGYSCYGCGDVGIVDEPCVVAMVMESCFCVVLNVREDIGGVAGC